MQNFSNFKKYWKVTALFGWGREGLWLGPALIVPCSANLEAALLSARKVHEPQPSSTPILMRRKLDVSYYRDLADPALTPKMGLIPQTCILSSEVVFKSTIERTENGSSQVV